MMDILQGVKQQAALFESIGHWEENERLLEERGSLDGDEVDAENCALCDYNKGLCGPCILTSFCGGDNPNPWGYLNTNPTHMVNYLKLHQLHSDILIEPGV